MVSTADRKTEGKDSNAWPLWSAIAAVALAIVATILLTRPAATVMSMTPLSGLMTLKSMAAETIPYETALGNQKPTLIEFYADWCTTCQSMSATVNALHEQYGDQMNFVMLDIDNPQWASEVANFGASGVPQFTLLDSDHQSVKTWVGKVPKSIFAIAFDRILN